MKMNEIAGAMIGFSSITGRILSEPKASIGLDELFMALSACVAFQSCYVAMVPDRVGPIAIWEVQYDVLRNSIVSSSYVHSRQFDISTYTRDIFTTDDFQNTFLWTSIDRAVNDSDRMLWFRHGIGCLSPGCSLQVSKRARMIMLLSHPDKAYDQNDQLALSGMTALLSACMSRLLPNMAEAEPSKLTKKELEIMSWVMYGKTSFEIGKIMEITERTVKFHLGNIYTKLGVCNRAQAAAAIRNLVPI